MAAPQNPKKTGPHMLAGGSTNRNPNGYASPHLSRHQFVHIDEEGESIRRLCRGRPVRPVNELPPS